MVNTIPKITQDLIAKIRADANNGTYREEFGEFKIDVFSYVFPPDSPFSRSSSAVYNQFGNLSGKKVLDVGTGTGIQAIQAVKAGADDVEAVDILPEAVECARYNVRINGLQEKIRVYLSDLFSAVPSQKRYDLIIANLPILDAYEEDLRFHSLMDPGFEYHKRLFKDAGNYLTKNGRIVLPHADLSSREDFKKLEKLAQDNKFTCRILKKIYSLGYEWRNYEFRRTK